MKLRKIKKKKNGFSTVEALLVLIIIILIGGVGWLVYKDHHKNSAATNAISTTTTKSASNTTSVSSSNTKTNQPDTYAGWTSYTLKYEKLTFKYPQSWTLTDGSDAKYGDIVTVNDGDNFQVEIEAGPFRSPETLGPNLSKQNVTFNSNPAILNLWGDDVAANPSQSGTTNQVFFILLTDASGNEFPSKDTTLANGTIQLIASYGNWSKGNEVDKSLGYVLADKDFADLKQIVQSMVY